MLNLKFFKEISFLMFLFMIVNQSLAKVKKKKKLIKKIKTKQRKLENTNYKCSPETLVSFGLLPKIKPEDRYVILCPYITHSCCNLEDEKRIYTNWIELKEEYNLKSRLKWHRSIYEQLFTELKKVREFSDFINKYL